MTWFVNPHKRCKKCGKIFDQGTNLDTCPVCRRNKKKVRKNGE